MRKIWVAADPWDKDLVTTALQGGADGIVVPKGYSDKVRELGKIQTISEDGDLKLGEDVVYFTIKSGEDEEEIARLSAKKQVILECTDWTIIPLENLIAKQAEVIAQVTSLEDAKTAFSILEIGVSHILLRISDPIELKNALSQLRGEEGTTPLELAEILEIKPIGMGDRVCVDTCTAMTEGQGMLVGNSSAALFLVHAESVSNPYVSPRPFRVNAGPVHAYTRVPGGKTRYLSELSAGDSVWIVDFNGKTTHAAVGRIKMEKRPLMLVTASCNGKKITAILQNAETIRLTAADGSPLSLVSLKPGDRVLVALEAEGRHFGHKIEETIVEK